jgi:hypothetical protein
VAERTVRMGFGLVGSVAVHAAVLGGAAFVLSHREPPPPPSLPIELIAVDAPSPPPVPAPAKMEPPRPEAAPAPKPKPKPKPVAVVQPEPEPSPEPEMPPEQPVEPPAEQPEAEAEAEAEDQPASQPAAQAMAMDLRPYVPGGARLMIVLRTDRLRGTRWAAALDAVLSPMPDYQTMIAPSALPLVDTFDSVVIATPDARDVTATFLAGRTTRDEAEVKKALTGPPSKPRVVWQTAQGGQVGRPVREPNAPIQDPRVILVPGGGWMLLTRPEHVAELLAPPAKQPTPPPSWMERLGKVIDDTGASEGPVLVVGIADLVKKVKMLPGRPPAPSRGTLAVHKTAEGFAVSGTLVFADEAAADTFLLAAEQRRREALDGMLSRGMLRAAHVLGMIEKLTVTKRGPLLEIRTELAADDAAALLEHAATWSRDYFESRRNID